MKTVVFEKQSLTSFELFEFGDGVGPTIAVIAGIHGNEQTGVHTANLLRKELHGQRIRGRVKLIPIANPAAYRSRNRCSPFDHLDLNRLFHVKTQESSYSHHLAEAIREEVIEAEYLLDLHCCSVYGSTYVCSQHGQYTHQFELSEALGIPAVVHSSGTAGQLFVEANRAGQKALLIELPGGQPDGVVHLEAAEECCRAILNYLRYLGIVEGEHVRRQVSYYNKIGTIEAREYGLFVPAAHPGTICRADETLGTFNGEIVAAPYDGIILAVQPAKYCFRGERMVRLAPNWKF